MEDENISIFRMKRNAASQLNRTFQSLIQKQFISLEDCYQALGLYFLNVDIIESWTALLHAKHENFETFLNDKERQNFISDCVSEFAQTRERLDPTSRLLLGGSSPTMQSEVTFWDMKFPNILISNLKKGGTYGCIYGLPRTGKTSLAVSFMELFIAETQLHILTNIVLKEDMEQIHFCPTLSSLVAEMANHPGWIAILDETGTFVGKKRALSTQNIDFENLGRFIGKLGGRLILITHDMARDVPPILQSWISEIFRKTELTYMIAILNKVGGLKMNRIIGNIPDSNLSFISEDITSLNFDLSIKDLLSGIQTMKGVERDEQKDAILDWIKNNKKSAKEERKEHEHAINRAEEASKEVSRLVKNGFSKMKAYNKVARKMGYTPETIRQYCMAVSRKDELDEEEDETHLETNDEDVKEEEGTGDEDAL